MNYFPIKVAEIHALRLADQRAGQPARQRVMSIRFDLNCKQANASELP